jgi:WD40 repeat protein
MKRKSVIQVLLIVIILSAFTPAVKVTPTQTLISSTKPISTEIIPTSTPLSEDKILDFALSTDGTKLAIYANTGIYIYDTETLSKTVFQDFRNLYYGKYKDKEPSGAVALSSDGNAIAVSGKIPDTPVDLWDLRTGQYIMGIYDIPTAYQVTKIQFSPDDKSIFIRSNYDWTMRCENADANFALHMLDFSDSPRATKVFSTDICQLIPMGVVRFTDNNKFLIFVQLMGPEYWVTTVDITPTTTAQEQAYESVNELYDISPNGKIYAFFGIQDNLLITNIVEAKTSKILRTIPYRVKLLDDENRLLIRDYSSLDSEWGLWENEGVTCNLKDLRT